MLRTFMAAAAIIAINLPFGFWRAGQRKFSLPWFLAVHAPVPLVVLIRLGAGLHWSLPLAPVLIGSYFGGQFLGARLRRTRAGTP